MIFKGTEFERKIDIQNYEFGWLRFQNQCYLKFLNNDDEKYSKNCLVN